MKTLRLLLATALPVLALLLPTGCEVDSASEQVLISPESATVDPGDQVQFTAASGYEYTWSLSGDDSLGYLSNKTGQHTTYVATAAPISNSLTRTLTVQSRIPNSGSGSTTTTTTDGTNTTTTTTSLPEEWTAEAQIIHRPTVPEPPPGVGVSVSPANATVDALNESVTFTAAGGDGNYSWVMNPSGWGTLTRPSANQATYTVTSTLNVGLLKLTVSSGGDSAQAAINHVF
jgi:plastocyanin